MCSAEQTLGHTMEAAGGAVGAFALPAAPYAAYSAGPGAGLAALGAAVLGFGAAVAGAAIVDHAQNNTCK